MEGVNTFISTQAFHSEFYVYTANGPSGNKGYLSSVSGANAEKCPAGRSLHATGKKLTPGIHPMGFVLGKPNPVSRVLISVYDSVSFLRGYIDPTSPTFTRLGMPQISKIEPPVDQPSEPGVEVSLAPTLSPLDVSLLNASVDQAVSQALPLAVSEALAQALPQAVSRALSEALVTSVPTAVSNAVTDSVAQAIPSAIAAVSQSVPSAVANAVAEAVPSAVGQAVSQAVGQAVAHAVAQVFPAQTQAPETKLLLTSRVSFPAGDYTVNPGEAGSSSIGTISNIPGKLAMKVNTSALREDSLIFLTPLGRGPTLVAVSDLQPSTGQFTIAAGSVCTVNWMILN